MSHAIDLHRRGLLRALSGTAALLALGATGAARAQPNATTRILVGSSAGSVPDLVARRVAERMALHSGRTFVVENRTGAAGQIAISALRSAPPDGGTLLLAPGAIATMYPAIYPRLTYDPDRDLQPVSTAAELSLALAVGSAVPDSVHDLRDFVAWARSNASQANFGSPGAGTPPHLLGALFASRAGVALQHVPYQGGPPAVADLLGGRLAAVFLPEGLLRPHLAARTVRILASSGAERSRFLPEIPTFAEQGLPDVVLREWFAFFLPGGTSRELVDRSADAIDQAVGDGQLAAAFSSLSLVPVASSPHQMAERIAAERKHWTPIIRAAGITVDS